MRDIQRNMLLPSAFDCAPRIQPSHSLYIPTPTLLSPPPTSSARPCPTSPVSSNIYSACRSLQSLITNTIPSTPSTISRPSRTQPQLASPIALTSRTSVHSRKQSRSQTPQCATKIAQPQTPRTPPRTSRKRRRSLCDDDADSPSHDQENIPPSTPKPPSQFPKIPRHHIPLPGRRHIPRRARLGTQGTAGESMLAGGPGEYSTWVGASGPWSRSSPSWRRATPPPCGPCSANAPALRRRARAPEPARARCPVCAASRHRARQGAPDGSGLARFHR